MVIRQSPVDDAPWVLHLAVPQQVDSCGFGHGAVSLPGRRSPQFPVDNLLAASPAVDSTAAAWAPPGPPDYCGQLPSQFGPRWLIRGFARIAGCPVGRRLA